MTRKIGCSQVIFGNGLSTHKNGLCASHLRNAFLARLAASRRRPVARGGATRSAAGSDGRRPGRHPKPLGGAQPAAAPMASRCGAAALRRRFMTRDCSWESNGRIFQTSHFVVVAGKSFFYGTLFITHFCLPPNYSAYRQIIHENFIKIDQPIVYWHQPGNFRVTAKSPAPR